MTAKPNHIPLTVGQALVWLDKMKIAYRYIPESELWVFVYADGMVLYG